MLIYITGRWSLLNPAMGFELARQIKAPIAILYNIPNQPLLGGKKEDALIAETFVPGPGHEGYHWPLLFPMAKSVVKAMDALQAFSKEELKEPSSASSSPERRNAAGRLG